MEGKRRNQRLGAGFDVVWIYGRSGSGKTTLAVELDTTLRNLGLQTMRLDPDKCRDLVSTIEAPTEMDEHDLVMANADIACKLAMEGILVIASFRTPLRMQRAMVSKVLVKQRVLMVHASATPVVCTGRGSKNPFKAYVDPRFSPSSTLYPFEEPDPMESTFIIDTQRDPVSMSAQILCTAVMGSRSRAG